MGVNLIEKPWAVYGWFCGSWDIGRIEHEFPHCVYIENCEGNFYFPEFENVKRVKRFVSPLEAASYFFEHQGTEENPLSIEEIIERLYNHFPEAMKQEEKRVLQSFHDTLIAYQNVRLSQSSPKCTIVAGP
jgi:hypothetical protein